MIFIIKYNADKFRPVYGNFENVSFFKLSLENFISYKFAKGEEFYLLRRVEFLILAVAMEK